jgi:hypothetical protein
MPWEGRAGEVLMRLYEWWARAIRVTSFLDTVALGGQDRVVLSGVRRIRKEVCWAGDRFALDAVRCVSLQTARRGGYVMVPFFRDVVDSTPWLGMQML